MVTENGGVGPTSSTTTKIQPINTPSPTDENQEVEEEETLIINSNENKTKDKIIQQNMMDMMMETSTAAEILTAVASTDNKKHYTCQDKKKDIEAHKSNGQVFGRAMHGAAYNETDGIIYIHGGLYFHKNYYSDGLYGIHLQTDKINTINEDNIKTLYNYAHNSSSKFGTTVQPAKGLKNSKLAKRIKSVFISNSLTSNKSLIQEKQTADILKSRISTARSTDSNMEESILAHNKRVLEEQIRKKEIDNRLLLSFTKAPMTTSSVQPQPMGEHGFLYRSYYHQFNSIKISDSESGGRPESTGKTARGGLRDSPRWKKKKDSARKEGDYLVTFGGLTNHFTVLSHMYMFDLKKSLWKQVNSPNPPAPLAGHSCIYIPHLDWMIIYGGYSSTGEVHGHVMRFSFRSKRWQCLFYDPKSRIKVDPKSLTMEVSQKASKMKKAKSNNTCPTRRYYHTADLYYPSQDCFDAKMVIISGKDSHYTEMKDTWFFNIAFRTWEKLSTFGESPLPIYGHATAIVNHNLYLFGGKYKFSNRLSSLNLVSGYWQRILFDEDVPPGIAFHSLIPVFPKYYYDTKEYYYSRWKENTSKHLAIPEASGSNAYFDQPKLMIIGGETEKGVSKLFYNICIEDEVYDFKNRLQYAGMFYDVFVDCSQGDQYAKLSNLKRSLYLFKRYKFPTKTVTHMTASTPVKVSPLLSPDMDPADPTPANSVVVSPEQEKSKENSVLYYKDVQSNEEELLSNVETESEIKEEGSQVCSIM